MSLRYDAAFYVQVLDRYVATGECAEADNEPLYAYLLSVMNDPMIRIQVLSDKAREISQKATEAKDAGFE